MPDDNAAPALTRIFRRLNEEWLDAAQSSSVTNERVLRELSLPSTAKTRLCYFSLPTGLISFYREVVFPYVAEVGLVPAVGDEIDPWSGSVQPFLEAILRRADTVIGDVSTNDPRVWNEVRSAAQREAGPRIGLVDDSPAAASHTPISGAATFVRPRDVFAGAVANAEAYDDANWVADLISWLAETRIVATGRLEDEARRLLEEGEFRAAVIASASAVEVALRDRIGRKEARPSGWVSPEISTMSFSRLVRDAAGKHLITKQEEQELRELQQTRNTLVHTRDPIDGRRARPVVDRTLRMLDRFAATPVSD